MPLRDKLKEKIQISSDNKDGEVLFQRKLAENDCVLSNSTMNLFNHKTEYSDKYEIHQNQNVKQTLDDHPRSNIPATGSHMILQERCGKVTGSHRKAPEIAGSGSSIPTGNLLDFFPVDSDQFPVLSSRNRSEIIGKNPKIFRLEYCFHVPVTSGAFLPEPARIFRPGIV